MFRHLAAILAADVSGYSRLVRADEEGTLRQLKRLRGAVIDPCIAGHQGRIFKTTGDGLLAEFPSVIDAVRCAVAMQRTLAEATRGVDANRRMIFRVGVHLGDVVADGDDLLGDGVNLASRIEEAAEPGGVCISSAVHEHVRDRLPQLALRDGGEREMRNLPRPVRVWHLAIPPASSSVISGNAGGAATDAAVPGWIGSPMAAASGYAAALADDRPSLAVLPFENLSADPTQNYFSDGITEEVIVAASRFRGLLVIARNASFTVRGRDGDPRAIGAKLGARYLLQGSVRRSGDRVRVSAQLVDTSSGAQLWAERYDRDLSDVLEVQDEITGRIIAAVAPHIGEAEIARTRLPGVSFTGSYELALRAQAAANEAREREDLAGVKAALAVAVQATRMQPPSAKAHEVLAQIWIRVSELANFSAEARRALREAQAAAERTRALAPLNHVAYLLMGHVAIHSQRGEDALRFLRRAFELNPNDPVVSAMLSWAESNDGQGDAALAHARDALRHTPVGRDRAMILWSLALACWVVGDYAAGVVHGMDAIAESPGLAARNGVAIACLVELGRLDEASRLLARAEALSPGYVKSRLAGKTWFTRSELADRYVAALRRAAGLPVH